MATIITSAATAATAATSLLVVVGALVGLECERIVGLRPAHERVVNLHAMQAPILMHAIQQTGFETNKKAKTKQKRHSQTEHRQSLFGTAINDESTIAAIRVLSIYLLAVGLVLDSTVH